MEIYPFIELIRLSWRNWTMQGCFTWPRFLLTQKYVNVEWTIPKARENHFCPSQAPRYKRLFTRHGINRLDSGFPLTLALQQQKAALASTRRFFTFSSWDLKNILLVFFCNYNLTLLEDVWWLRCVLSLSLPRQIKPALGCFCSDQQVERCHGWDGDMSPCGFACLCQREKGS